MRNWIFVSLLCAAACAPAGPPTKDACGALAEVMKISQSLLPGKRIDPQTRYVDDLGVDALDAVEIVMAVEDKYHITISDSEAERIVTPADMAQLIRKKTSCKE